MQRPDTQRSRQRRGREHQGSSAPGDRPLAGREPPGPRTGTGELRASAPGAPALRLYGWRRAIAAAAAPPLSLDGRRRPPPPDARSAVGRGGAARPWWHVPAPPAAGLPPPFCASRGRGREGFGAAGRELGSSLRRHAFLAAPRGRGVLQQPEPQHGGAQHPQVTRACPTPLFLPSSARRRRRRGLAQGCRAPRVRPRPWRPPSLPHRGPLPWPLWVRTLAALPAPELSSSGLSAQRGAAPAAVGGRAGGPHLTQLGPEAWGPHPVGILSPPEPGPGWVRRSGRGGGVCSTIVGGPPDPVLQNTSWRIRQAQNSSRVSASENLNAPFLFLFVFCFFLPPLFLFRFVSLMHPKTGAALCTEREPFPVAGKLDKVFGSEC